MNKYESMPIKELEKAKRELGVEIRALKQKRHEAQLVWNSRQSEVRMQALAGRLSTEEKAHLAQVISPEGISATEGVGKPGMKGRAA